MTNNTTYESAVETEPFQNATFGPPCAANPDDPFRVTRSHLMKMDPGKSSSSCKLSMVTRLHRGAVLQEHWCASYEEYCVNLCIAAHPDVINMKEQLTRVDFENLDGRKTHTKVDTTALLKDWSVILVSVKYDEKARRPAYLAEVANAARQCSSRIADRFVVSSRYTFHPAYRKCAEEIHLVRRGWDPEADRIVYEAALELGQEFTLVRLIEKSQLCNRGRRAAIRLIADGDIEKRLLDPFAANTVCRLAA